jgi:AcrR family transcriptional regulator
VARPARFSSDDIFDAASRLVRIGGPSSATVVGIAQELGAPTGSIHHRFDSRDLLLARVWIRTARQAQAGFVGQAVAPSSFFVSQLVCV